MAWMNSPRSIWATSRSPSRRWRAPASRRSPSTRCRSSAPPHYAAEDADVTLRLWLLLKPRLVSKHKTTVYETLERPLVPVLAATWSATAYWSIARCWRGFRTNSRAAPPRWRRDPQARGERFNIGSPKQLGDILFGRMGLAGGRKTQTGAWCTDSDVLEDLAAQGVELAQKVLDWRQLAKLRSTYTDALPGYINPETGRVHTSYALASTSTGRLSSTDPNLQNIPVRTPEGRRIRTAFIAAHGLQAHQRRLQPDRTARARPCRRHSATEEGLRRRARHSRHDGIGNVRRADRGHGSPGATARQGDQFRHHLRHFGFRPCQPARHSARGGGRLHQDLFQALSRHSRLYGETRKRARDQGYVETMFGRRRHFPRINSSNPSERAFMERAAINAPIQGAAADIIRRAMIRMQPALDAAGLKAQMLLQVHDELVLRDARCRGRGDKGYRQGNHGEGAGAGGQARRAFAGRCARGAELGRGALTEKRRAETEFREEPHQWIDAVSSQPPARRCRDRPSRQRRPSRSPCRRCNGD